MKVAKFVGVGVGIVVLAVIIGVVLVKVKFNKTMSKSWEIEVAQIEVPFPLTEEEVDALREEELARQTALALAYGKAIPDDFDPLSEIDLDKVALERAVARGEHYMNSRAACTHCHGEDLGGKMVADAMPVFRMICPNITTGTGSVVSTYTTDDWVRIIRHGVNQDKHASPMPSLDYTWFSDQEVSDLIAYIQSQPPVDRTMDPAEVGFIGKMLIAQGKIPISAELIDHQAARLKYPPEEQPTADFGKHLVQVCTGCHGQNLSGGPILGGDPNWPQAPNLTKHPSGLGDWGYEDFEKAMRTTIRPDGTLIGEPFPAAYTKNLSDIELLALWKYIESVPAVEMGER